MEFDEFKRIVLDDPVVFEDALNSYYKLFDNYFTIEETDDEVDLVIVKVEGTNSYFGLRGCDLGSMGGISLNVNVDSDIYEVEKQPVTVMKWRKK